MVVVMVVVMVKLTLKCLGWNENADWGEIPMATSQCHL